jgi:hypothetical protein
MEALFGKTSAGTAPESSAPALPWWMSAESSPYAASAPYVSAVTATPVAALTATR